MLVDNHYIFVKTISFQLSSIFYTSLEFILPIERKTGGKIPNFRVFQEKNRLNIKK